ncbi:MAG: hypothetical protein QW035_01290 [Candidatus Anstonellales archaeon]
MLELAAAAVGITVVLGGMLLGIGTAFGITRLSLMGKDELFQAVINAAIVGSFALIEALSLSIVTLQGCERGGIGIIPCYLTGIAQETTELIDLHSQLSMLVGYYQSLVLDFSQVTIAPLANLSHLAGLISIQLNLLLLSTAMIGLAHSFSELIEAAAFSFLLPLGLLLRAFFITRRAGNFLVAFSFSFFLLFPAIFLMVQFPDEVISDAKQAVSSVLENPLYSSPPVAQINSNYAVAEKLDQLSQGRFVEDILYAVQAVNRAISAELVYFLIVPLIGAIVSLVVVVEWTLGPSIPGGII